MLSLLAIGCEEVTLAEGRISHLLPCEQVLSPCPGLRQILQICLYLHSASEFLQVLALNLLHGSVLPIPRGFPVGFGVDFSDDSIPSGMTMAEYSLVNLLKSVRRTCCPAATSFRKAIS